MGEMCLVSPAQAAVSGGVGHWAREGGPRLHQQLPVGDWSATAAWGDAVLRRANTDYGVTGRGTGNNNQTSGGIMLEQQPDNKGNNVGTTTRQPGE